MALSMTNRSPTGSRASAPPAGSTSATRGRGRCARHRGRRGPAFGDIERLQSAVVQFALRQARSSAVRWPRCGSGSRMVSPMTSLRCSSPRSARWRAPRGWCASRSAVSAVRGRRRRRVAGRLQRSPRSGPVRADPGQRIRLVSASTDLDGLADPARRLPRFGLRVDCRTCWANDPERVDVLIEKNTRPRLSR